MTTNRPLRVFLCYSNNDKIAVRELYKKLTDYGIDVWLDEKKLLPGYKWRIEIHKAVRESDVVIVCLSKTSITKEGYVQAEIKSALDVALEKPEGTIFLIPAKLEECKVPNNLTDWQWVDLFDVQGFTLLLDSLKKRADALGLQTTFVEKEESLSNRLSSLKFYRRSVHIEYKVNADANVVSNYLIQHYKDNHRKVGFDNLSIYVDELEMFTPAKHDVFQYGFIAKGHKSSKVTNEPFSLDGKPIAINSKLEIIPELFFITISQGQRDISILSFDTDVKHAHMFTTELVRMLSKAFSVRIIS